MGARNLRLKDVARWIRSDELATAPCIIIIIINILFITLTCKP